MAAATRIDADVSRRLDVLEERMATLERDRVEDQKTLNKQLGSIHEKINTVGLQTAAIAGAMQGKQANLGNVIALLALLVAAGTLLSKVVG